MNEKNITYLKAFNFGYEKTKNSFIEILKLSVPVQIAISLITYYLLTEPYSAFYAGEVDYENIPDGLLPTILATSFLGFILLLYFYCIAYFVAFEKPLRFLAIIKFLFSKVIPSLGFLLMAMVYLALWTIPLTIIFGPLVMFLSEGSVANIANSISILQTSIVIPIMAYLLVRYYLAFAIAIFSNNVPFYKSFAKSTKWTRGYRFSLLAYLIGYSLLIGIPSLPYHVLEIATPSLWADLSLSLLGTVILIYLNISFFAYYKVLIPAEHQEPAS